MMELEFEKLPGIYNVDVKRSGPLNAYNSYSWTVSFISIDNEPTQIYAEGKLLQGSGSKVSVNNLYCPYTNRTGIVTTSKNGVVGETFLAFLDGSSHVKANVTYEDKGIFTVTYLTPRTGTYNLTVAKTKKGGLVGTYYNNRWMYGDPIMTRVDPIINFYWGVDDAITETGKDYISVRWEGYLLPSFSEVYEFSFTVNDGVRLWVDDVLLIDSFENDMEESGDSTIFTAKSATALIADQLTSIKIEYRENTGVATAVLAWSSLSQPHEIIPGYRLFPGYEEIKSSPFIIKPTTRKPTLVQNVQLSIYSWNQIKVDFNAPLDDGGSPILGYTVEWFSNKAIENGDLEIQTIKKSPNVIGGTFTLGFKGVYYPYPIPFDVSDKSLEEIIERLPGVGDVTVNSYASNGVISSSWAVTFLTNTGNVDDLVLNTQALILSTNNGDTMTVCVNGAVSSSGSLSCIALDSKQGNSTLYDGGMSGQNTYKSVSMEIGSNTHYTYVIDDVDQTSAKINGYSIRVYATNSDGHRSIPTKALSLKPMAVPIKPKFAEVVRAAGSDNSLMVYWSFIPYPMDRASPVTAFVIQWSTLSNFTVVDGEYQNINGIFSSDRKDFELGSAMLEFNITNLTPGNKYYVRVCGVNTMGRGEFQNAIFAQYNSYAIVPRSKPDSLVYGNGVLLSSIASSSSVSVLESSTSLKVNFNSADNFHGSSIRSYQLEWWVEDYTPEVKTLTITGTTSSSLTGVFRILYNGDKTDYLNYNISNDKLRTELENLEGIRSVFVEKNPVSNGFAWSITFLQDFPSVYNIPLTIDDSELSGKAVANIADTSVTTLPLEYNIVSIESLPSVTSYSYVIRNLSPGTSYNVRVSPVNSEGVGIGQLSFPQSLSPPLQKPSEPLDLSLFTYSASAIKILYKAPESNGGDRITKYKIEWDVSPYFNTSEGWPIGSQHKVVTAVDDCILLHCNYIIHSLDKSIPYHVRVFSYNSYGYSELPGLPSERYAVPITQPEPPSLVAVSTTSNSSLLVTISPPLDDGGAPVEHYKVEWDVLGAEAYDTVVNPDKSLLYSPYSVQVIQSRALQYDIEGYFYLQFDGFATDKISVESSAVDFEKALEVI